MPFAVTDIDAMTVIGINMKDPFTAELMQVYITMLKLSKGLIDVYPRMYKKEFSSITDYENVYKMFLAKIKAIPQVVGLHFCTYSWVATDPLGIGRQKTW